MKTKIFWTQLIVLVLFIILSTYLPIHAQNASGSVESGEVAGGSDDGDQPTVTSDSSHDSDEASNAAAEGSSNPPLAASASAATTAPNSGNVNSEPGTPDNGSSTVASGTEKPGADDLSTAYEHWKGQGIRFVVRQNGKLITWGTGHLESWAGNSVWVVRDTKGHFLTRATGNVETRKNGSKRLVIRDKTGRILANIDLNLTGKGSFAKNVIGLRKLRADNRYLDFVQESLANTILVDLKASETVHLKTLLNYIQKNKTQEGMTNFIPVLKAVSRQLKFLAIQERDQQYIDLGNKTNELLGELSKLPKTGSPSKIEKTPSSPAAKTATSDKPKITRKPKTPHKSPVATGTPSVKPNGNTSTPPTTPPDSDGSSQGKDGTTNSTSTATTSGTTSGTTTETTSGAATGTTNGTNSGTNTGNTSTTTTSSGATTGSASPSTTSSGTSTASSTGNSAGTTDSNTSSNGDSASGSVITPANDGTPPEEIVPPDDDVNSNPNRPATGGTSTGN
ncbi:MAG: hypothetical protein HQM08_20345 [Candidatus Riflebacteria bacterium]|nr:hypothetical protein [Candidatus Riflebacteria bacterium]